MNNFVDTGDDVVVTLGAGETTVKSGDAYMVGDLIGFVSVLLRNGNTVFANQASAEGDTAVLKLKGTYKVAKPTNQAWALGAKVYLVAASRTFTTVATGNTLAGLVGKAAAEADPFAELRLKAQ